MAIQWYANLKECRLTWLVASKKILLETTVTDWLQCQCSVWFLATLSDEKH